MTNIQEQSDLHQRLQFLGLGEKTSATRKSLATLIDRELPTALARFYDRVRETSDMKRFFSSDEHMSKAQSAQIGHWSAIRDGRFDEAYVKRVQVIGMTHARIGLEPRWYIGGYALIVEHLMSAILREISMSSSRWSGKKSDIDQSVQAVGALIKGIFLDMDYSITVYLEAAEERRKRGEQDAKTREQKLVSATIGAAARKLAEKDLTHRIPPDLPEAYRRLREDINLALTQLGSALAAVAESTNVIKACAGEMATAADNLAHRTEQQAAGLEQTAASLDQVTSTVQQTAQGASNAQGLVAAAMKDAEASGSVVATAVKAMGGIERSSHHINQIIGVMDEIAFQTNLLALNAGVEAARAGEAGKGFAVVASEVRALAQRSAEAAKEIKSLIAASTSDVAQGVSLVAKTGEALSAISSKVRSIHDIINDIALGAHEQATALQQVNTAINRLDQNTQQNAAMVEQATASSHSLTHEAVQLAELVGEFNLGVERERLDARRSSGVVALPSQRKKSRSVV